MRKRPFYAKRSLRVLLSVFLCVLFLVPAWGSAGTGTPKYVFLFIGDGMGFPQKIAAAQYINGKMLMDTFPSQGVTMTSASNRFITGSAAAATAIACGKKTTIGRIAMDAEMKPLKTVAELAKARGMKVGIVTSVSIDHATPAAFYAHVAQRSQYYDIDVALAESGLDYFAGGGLKDPANKKGNAAAFKGNALELIRKNGYKVVETRQAFDALTPADGKVLAINGWLQDDKAMPYDMDRTKEDISLAEFTQKGIALLENPNGFFMMVEAGKIDWACHANDAAAAVKDTLALDKAVEKAYAFYKAHPRETLIVVTGDHECGGMSLGFAGTKYETYFDVLKHQTMSYKNFDLTVMKALRKGEGSAPCFDDVKVDITRAFGLVFPARNPNTGEKSAAASDNPLLLAPHEVARLEAAFARTMAGEKEKSSDPEAYLLYGGYNPLTVTITHILNQKAGIAWTSYKHTGVPISTSAIGVGADAYMGAYENTGIALKLMGVMGMKPAPTYAVN